MDIVAIIILTMWVIMFPLNVIALRYQRDVTVGDLIITLVCSLLPFLNVSLFYILGGFELVGKWYCKHMAFMFKVVLERRRENGDGN